MLNQAEYQSSLWTMQTIMNDFNMTMPPIGCFFFLFFISKEKKLRMRARFREVWHKMNFSFWNTYDAKILRRCSYFESTKVHQNYRNYSFVHCWFLYKITEIIPIASSKVCVDYWKTSHFSWRLNFVTYTYVLLLTGQDGSYFFRSRSDSNIYGL